MKPLAQHVPSRVVIEGIDPEVDAGRFPVKRTVGETVVIGADIHTDGHDLISATLKYRHLPAAGSVGTGSVGKSSTGKGSTAQAEAGAWTEAPMTALVNDRWTGTLPLEQPGWYEFTIQAWIDWFATWRRDLIKKTDAGQNVETELVEGAAMVRRSASGATKADAAWLNTQAERLEAGNQTQRVAVALDPALLTLMETYVDRRYGITYDRPLRIWAERERARFGSWYELFPRSCADEPGQHGTFADVEKRLGYIAAMNFNVLYLPPIHPIGLAFRKGPNNTLTPGPTDPGSPWAIGGPEGGHKAVNPRLGTLADFDHLLKAATAAGIEIALDIAFQCSPDHPYVKAHPQWFKHRPDGTIKYAENPPKKYQDIYPIDFECDDWQNLWQELCSVIIFWAERGVRIFRVDNPHTKPFRFWEWCIGSVQEKYPDAIFLSEAFTRPKVMKYLAKSGFTQSYSYFTWRNAKTEITEYFEELTQTDVGDYMRPNLFANTPDILPEFLQFGGPPAFHIRLVLAATLGASYGIYGPPFETFEGTPVAPGKEEYLNSEKYQIRDWDWHSPSPFRELIGIINQARNENPALQYDRGLEFHETDNDQLIFYSKTNPEGTNTVLSVVNLDPYHVQSGWVQLPLEQFGFKEDESYQVQDLITGAYYLWHGEWNFVSLDPQVTPAHILRLRRKARTEQDFDYFM